MSTWAARAARRWTASIRLGFTPPTRQPSIMGKGFGDLPDGLKYLKPFALTGTLVGVLHPGRVGQCRRFIQLMRCEWGFSPWSTACLICRNTWRTSVMPRRLFRDLIPVWSSFQNDARCSTNRGGETTTVATINPGILWEGQPVLSRSARRRSSRSTAHTGPECRLLRAGANLHRRPFLLSRPSDIPSSLETTNETHTKISPHPRIIRRLRHPRPSARLPRSCRSQSRQHGQGAISYKQKRNLRPW